MDNTENIDSGAPKAPGMREKFYVAAATITLACRGTYTLGHFDKDGEWVLGAHVLDAPEDARHQWHVTLQDTSPHAAVLDVLDDDFLPADLDKLVMEWPTVSTDGRLAYTQSVAKGRIDARTVTTPGRFITRHWPKLPTDYIRDVVARNTARVEVWHDADEIVRAAMEGPGSCMTGDRFEADDHPYRVYDPQYGWRIAVRLEGAGEIWARALLLMPSRGPYVEGETIAGAKFVRTYKKCPQGGYSYADEALCAWLEQQGVEKEDSWPRGAKLARVDRHGRRGSSAPFVAPYIDGDVQQVDDEGSYLTIDRKGAYKCDRTDGAADEEDDNSAHCTHCDDSCDADGGIYVGFNGDDYVGDCCSDQYEHGYGRGGRKYYFPSDDAVQVGDTYYHQDHLAHNNIVELGDGEYASADDAFCCAVDDCWYLNDDGVSTEDEGMAYTGNAWQCAATDLWYSTFVSSVENAEGETVHPDSGDEFVGPPAPRALPAAAVVDPDRVFMGPPPSDGWWNVMYSHAGRGEHADEWNRFENGVFTHRVHGLDVLRGTPAEWASNLSTGLQPATLSTCHTLSHRRRQPAWAAEAERAIAAPPPAAQDRVDVMAAHAAGAVIQYRGGTGWGPVYNNSPLWVESTEYRVDPAQEYTHPRIRPSVRYRAGATGRIDVWGSYSGAAWNLGVGGSNTDLTTANGYEPAPGRIADAPAPAGGAFVPVSDYTLETI